MKYRSGEWKSMRKMATVLYCFNGYKKPPHIGSYFKQEDQQLLLDFGGISNRKMHFYITLCDIYLRSQKLKVAKGI